MKDKLLEAGRIVNTHGIKGEVKLEPWCDTPQFLLDFPTLYVDGSPVKVSSARVNKTHLILALEGVDDINAAMRLKGKVVHISREDVHLPPGRHFIADLVGLEVREADGGRVLGVLEEVLDLPAQAVYVVQGEKRYMIPAVDAFIAETRPEEGYIAVRLIEGMGE